MPISRLGVGGLAVACVALALTWRRGPSRGRATGGPFCRAVHLLRRLDDGLTAYCLAAGEFPPGPYFTMCARICKSCQCPGCPRAQQAAGRRSYLDPWGMPLRYFPTRVNGSPAYFLYSQGPNTCDEKGLGDDICRARIYGPRDADRESWVERPDWVQLPGEPPMWLSSQTRFRRPRKILRDWQYSDSD